MGLLDYWQQPVFRLVIKSKQSRGKLAVHISPTQEVNFLATWIRAYEYNVRTQSAKQM
jgi:hypothetical protein